MGIGKPGSISAGNIVTSVGALLAFCTLLLAYGLIFAHI